MENEYGTPNFNITPEPDTSYVHPVLTQLNDKIADLEAKLAKANELDAERVQNANRLRNEKWQYEERVKTVLVESLEDHDEETVKHIASELGIELTKTKTVEVNVTFTIDLEYEIGEEPDLDWDLDFDVRHDSIVDFQTDIVWSKDA